MLFVLVIPAAAVPPAIPAAAVPPAIPAGGGTGGGAPVGWFPPVVWPVFGCPPNDDGDGVALRVEVEPRAV